jgi:putative phosphoribosyl transferase
MLFRDRLEAGQRLATALQTYRDTDAVVYALPRGGVVVGAAIADALRKPLEVLLPRKIGHPFNPEFAIGAVTDEGHAVWNEAMFGAVDPEWLKVEGRRQQEEAIRQRNLYLSGRASLTLKGKTALVADDGIATGLTMRAALRQVRDRKPATIVVAVPVAPSGTVSDLSREADEVVVLSAPDDFLGAVGEYYRHFDQVSDVEVLALVQSRRP